MSSGGLYYGLNGDPSAECVVTSGIQGLFDDCLILADDFRQYYLGAFTRVGLSAAPDQVRGIAEPITGYRGALGGGTNALDEPGLFEATSDVLPVSEFPQFRSWGVGTNSPSSGTRSPRPRVRTSPASCTRTRRTCACRGRST